jgi:hypothetical protein
MKLTKGPFLIYEIIPGKLYQRGEIHHFSPDLKARGLAYYGITHAVALAPKWPDTDLVEWDPDIFGYTHMPITDGELKPGSGMALKVIAARMADDINAGGCVLSMCEAGRNRSGLMSALIVRKIFGMSGADALEYVQTQRPNALANEHFAEFLRELP